ncbi:Initiator Replication protein [Butyrivibrio sp. ob235]|uniref:replication initiation protein n=1 Tax=Butyrivibrio sp. ob235 TaxID=1761780 RepID=UPI0008D75E0D|nr:replication initiation protein [Butyrivibrio sp. ob235]SEM59181.1 Initiator Replication protein [Butyrivibrio sp. ob235]
MGKKKSEKYNIDLLKGKNYSKSNALVNSKGKANLLAQKLFAIGIQQATEDEKSGILTAELRGTDLRKVFGNNNGSFYDEIKALVEPIKDKPSLMDWRIVFTDDTTKSVEAINIVTDCRFEDGIFQMRFNDKVNKEIRQLKQNYTVFSLAETIPLKSIYSFKLYEMLKAEYDKQDYIARKSGQRTNNPTYVTDINIVDLKLRFGIIDSTTDKKIADALKKADPDYEKIAEMAEGQKDNAKYKRFSNFRKGTIEVAQKELAEKTSISFEFEQLKSGRGGKTTGIRFFIKKKEPEQNIIVEETKEELTEDDIYQIVFDAKQMLGEEFSIKDIRAICSVANYDLSKIESAKKIMDGSKSKITNPTGWLINAIKEEYEESKSINNSNGFHNFEQSDFNYAELEKQLLDN